MNSFKRHFYQIVKEDPDAVDRWGLRWEDQDSRTFCLASKFLTYTLDEGTTHNALLFALQQEWTKTGNLIFRDEHVIRQKDGKTFVYHGDFSSLETLFEQERPFVRSDVLKLGKAQKWGLFMGRIWTDTQVVSFWNDLPDFKQNDLTKLKDFLVFHMNLDINQIKLEIVDQSEYQIFSWVEMTDRIKNNLKPTDMKVGDKLHLTPPEKKGQMMKDMGIQPKINPNNIADRYKLNKESFKEYFYAFLEARQEMVDKIGDALNKVEDRPFGELFGKTDRFLIKVWNPQFEKNTKALGLDLSKFDWKNSTYMGNNINAFIKKLRSPEILMNQYAKESGSPWDDDEDYEATLHDLNTRYRETINGDQYFQKIYERISKIKQAIDQKNVYYYLMFSRHPIDVLRMSDHKGISSCHRLQGAYNSTEGDYADCALADASNDGGIVYLIRGGDAKKIKDRLDQPDVFEDKDRAVEGIRPIGRIRLRRFIDVQTGEDWAIPTAFQNEQKYGFFTQELYKIVLRYCQSNQAIFKDPPEPEYAEENIVMMGGSYSDEFLEILMDNFFKTAKYNNIKHKSGHYIGWQEEMNKLLKQSADFKFHKITMAEVNSDRTVEFGFEVDAPVGIIKTEDDTKEFSRLQKQWDETYTYKAIERHRPIIRRKLQIVQKNSLAWAVGEFRFILNDPEEVNEYIKTFARDEKDITEFFGSYL
jgi:hypothetical protein